MATFTTYKNLEKPDVSELYNINVANKNNDIIDSELHKIDLNMANQTGQFASKQDLSNEISRAISAENDIHNSLQSHTDNTANPHNVTKVQVGLENADNTSDMDKPVSTAQQNALDAAISAHNIAESAHDDIRLLLENKVDKISGMGLSENDYTTIDKNKLDGIAEGANVNVQPDWNITDTANDAFIKNKPTIPTNQMLMDLIKDYVGDLSGGVPLAKGYMIASVDRTMTFSNGRADTTETFTELFGIENKDDIVFISAMDSSTNATGIDCCTIKENGTILIVNRGGSNAVNSKISIFCIYKSNTPEAQNTEYVMKGVRVVTIPVDTAFAANVQSIVVGNVSDYGISVNNVIGCCGSLALDRGTTNERVATAVIGVLSTGQLVIRESSGYAPTARIKMDGVITLFVRDLDIEDITLDDLPAATEITETDKLLLGQDAQNKSIEMSGFMDFMRENGLFDLDGKGRPLLPGYGIVTKSVTLNIPAGSILICDTGISITDFGVTDIVDVFAISKELNWPFYPYISKGNITLYNPQSCPAFNNVSAIIGAIYKQKVPYEPGLKTVKYTKTFTLRPGASASASISFCEFNLSDLSQNLRAEDIVNVQVIAHNTNSDVYNAVPILADHGLMRIFCLLGGGTYADQTFDLIFTVKDYSSIGPAIVTEGIRMITRKVSFTTYGKSVTMILRESDLDVAFEDIIAVDFKSDSLDGYTGYAVLNVPEKKIDLITRANTGNGQTFSGVLSYIVKVPVVEPRKPFVKDVEVTLSGTNGIPTGIILDGSEEVGGYTVENISSITAIPITIGMWINPPTIGKNNQIFLTKQYSSSDGKCSVRIRIE